MSHILQIVSIICCISGYVLKFKTRYYYTVSQKTCTPKAGWHKFIKISSPIMIFHTRHNHSVADQLSSKSLVRVEYQLQGFHGNKTTNNPICCSLRSAFGGDVALYIAYK